LTGDDVTSVKAADTVRFATIGSIVFKNSVFYNTASGSSLDNSDVDTRVTLRNVSWENVDVVESLFGATFFANHAGAVIEDEFVKNVRQGPVYAALIETSSGPGDVAGIVYDQFAAATYGPNGKGGKYGNFLRGKSGTQAVSNVAFYGFTVGGMLQRDASRIQVNAYVKGLHLARSGLPVVQIAASADHALRKPLQPATIVVSRTGSLARTLVLPLLIAGSAKNGIDYQQITASVTIPQGKASASFAVVPLSGDGLKTVRIELDSHPFDLSYALGPAYGTVVTIAG
jgi:hypothetical protein